MQNKPSPFANSDAVASYKENALHNVPGLADLHRMTMLLLAEHAPAAAHMLIVGAGGGMEIKAMAETQPDWLFTGVDPSQAMLELAHQTVMPFTDRVILLEGTVDQAPAGPFDGATCLLTLHHIDRSERLNTLRKIRHRLKPGACIVIAGHSAPEPDPVQWMARSAAFSNRTDLDWESAWKNGKMRVEHMQLLNPTDQAEQLHQAGFQDVALFYAAFSFRGWVGVAG